MGDDQKLKEIGDTLGSRAMDLIGHPRNCAAVEFGTRLVTQKLLENAHAVGDLELAGQTVGKNVKQLCLQTTRGGRTVIVLAGTTAAVVYGVVNYDDVEPEIKKALKEAKVPVTIPLGGKKGKKGSKDTLTLGLGLQDLSVQWEHDFGTGSLKTLGIQLSGGRKEDTKEKQVKQVEHVFFRIFGTF